MAWLQATPKPDTNTRRGKFEGQEAPTEKLSRLARMKKDGIIPQMPPNPAPHILGRLIAIGLTESNGMGATPLSWREINEWQRATAIDLDPWEAQLIRKLSAEYLAESNRAESENCPPPWRAPVTQQEIEVEEARLRKVLG